MPMADDGAAEVQGAAILKILGGDRLEYWRANSA